MNDVRDLKADMRHLRHDLDVVATRVIRIDNVLPGLRDALSRLRDHLRALTRASWRIKREAAVTCRLKYPQIHGRLAETFIG